MVLYISLQILAVKVMHHEFGLELCTFMHFVATLDKQSYLFKRLQLRRQFGLKWVPFVCFMHHRGNADCASNQSCGFPGSSLSN